MQLHRKESNIIKIKFQKTQFYLWYEIYKSFWYKYDTIVMTEFGSFAYHISNVVRNMFKGLFVSSNLQQDWTHQQQLFCPFGNSKEC